MINAMDTSDETHRAKLKTSLETIAAHYRNLDIKQRGYPPVQGDETLDISYTVYCSPMDLFWGDFLIRPSAK